MAHLRRKFRKQARKLAPNHAPHITFRAPLTKQLTTIQEGTGKIVKTAGKPVRQAKSVQKKISKGVSPVRKGIVSAVKEGGKLRKTVKKGSVKGFDEAIKFAEKSATEVPSAKKLRVVGEVAQITGSVLTLAAPLAAPFGPEAVFAVGGAGIGLKKGGQKLKQVAKVQRQVERLDKKTKEGGTVSGGDIAGIISAGAGVINNEKFDKFAKGVEKAGELVDLVKRDNDIIKKEEEIIMKEQEENKQLLNVIDQLGDRLAEETGDLKTRQDFENQLKNLALDQMAGFFERNFKEIERLSPEDRFELYVQAGFI